MNRNILLFLLVLSVLFNLFFSVGALRARRQLTTPEVVPAAITLVADELDLDEAQRETYNVLRREFKTDTANLQDALQLAQQDLWTELTKEQVDETRVVSALDRETKLRQQMRQASSEQLRLFAHSLSPQQRQKLYQRLGHEGRNRQRAGRMLKRFDRDGDGRLSAEEREAARQQMEKDLNDRSTRREGIRRRFDVNQNGQLDPDELAAMREWMRSQSNPNGGRRPPRGGRNGQGR